MEEKVQKRFHFIDLSSSYGESKIDVPFGYNFFQFLSIANGQNYDRAVAVFIENEELLDAKERIRAEIQKSFDYRKAQDEKKLNDKIAKMNLMQEFSDIVTKFDIGDYVWYYSFNEYIPADSEHKKHIRSFRLDEVTYRGTNVVIEGNKGEKVLYVEFSSYGEKARAKDLFKTEQEALDGTKEQYAVDLQKLKDKKEKQRLDEEAQKQKEEEEILKKAEEIKNKKP